MHHYHSKFGNKNDEYIQKILVDDFSDIVDIIWGGDVQMMNVRLNVGGQSKGILSQSEKIVILWIESVEKNRDKHYSIEHMMQELCNIQR